MTQHVFLRQVELLTMKNDGIINKNEKRNADLIYIKGQEHKGDN